jgi:hypothetical protein
MWVGVVLICISPADVRTCDVLVRTDGTFFTETACNAQVKEDVQGMLNQRPLYARYKCYEINGSA